MPSFYEYETDGIGKWQVIAQFDSPPQQSDFTQNGLNLLKQTSIIEAYLLEGTPIQIMELSFHPELTWLEWNSPRKLLMDTTVDVISARDAWDTARLRADVGFDIGSTGPRGSGVSVIVLDSGIDATHPDMNYAPQSVNNPNTPGLEDKVSITLNLTKAQALVRLVLLGFLCKIQTQHLDMGHIALARSQEMATQVGADMLELLQMPGSLVFPWVNSHSRLMNMQA